jgi:hypothetical protein
MSQSITVINVNDSDTVNNLKIMLKKKTETSYSIHSETGKTLVLDICPADRKLSNGAFTYGPVHRKKKGTDIVDTTSAPIMNIVIEGDLGDRITEVCNKISKQIENVIGAKPEPLISSYVRADGTQSTPSLSTRCAWDSGMREVVTPFLYPGKDVIKEPTEIKNFRGAYEVVVTGLSQSAANGKWYLNTELCRVFVAKRAPRALPDKDYE